MPRSGPAAVHEAALEPERGGPLQQGDVGLVGQAEPGRELVAFAVHPPVRVVGADIVVGAVEIFPPRAQAVGEGRGQQALGMGLQQGQVGVQAGGGEPLAVDLIEHPVGLHRVADIDVVGAVVGAVELGAPEDAAFPEARHQPVGEAAQVVQEHLAVARGNGSGCRTGACRR